MTDRDKRHANREEEAIAPAQVTLNAQPQSAASGSGQSAWRQYPLVIAGLAVSLVLLLGVVFLLPDMVSPVQTPKSTGPSTAQAGEREQAAPKGPTESPWRDAQFAKARRETQAILEKMLEKQEALEEISVEQWAAEDYAAARQLAETADQHYREQEFAKAQALYQDSLEQFEVLLDRSESVFQSAVTAGQQAIVDGDAALAREQFQLAARIKPEDQAVITGLERAQVLEDVLAKVDAGEELQRDGELEAAKAEYQAALKLDAESRLANRRLKEVEQAIADRNFGKHMSRGFAAMSDSDYPKAIAAFQQALDIRPQAADARNALTQAQNESTHSRLQALLSQARQHEKQEEWQSAVDSYQRALKLDENLVEARVGAIRAGTRAEIDRKMENILSSPERLTTPAVHQDYQEFYRETRSIQNPGPRLSRQLEQLNDALRLAVQPVTVQFRSDNATQVTLYRVGKLGNFQQTELTLKPGTYTVVGTREGYRDVRREFTISASEPLSSPITVQCEEKISQG